MLLVVKMSHLKIKEQAEDLQIQVRLSYRYDSAK